MIRTKIYLLPQNITLTPNILKEYIQLFWNDIFNPLQLKNSNMHLMLMVKVLFTDDGYRTLADLRRVNFTDNELFTDFLIDRLGFLSDSYQVNPIDKIIFSYIDQEGLASDNRSLMQPAIYKVTSHGFNNLQLPLTMNPAEYGSVLAMQTITTDEQSIDRYVVRNRHHVFVIDRSLDNSINSVKLEGPADLQWVDTKISDNTFKSRVAG